MSYEMRQLRKEDISLYYHIKHKALIDFIETEEMAPLRELEMHEACAAGTHVYEPAMTWCGDLDNAAVFPDPRDRGRGWVYLDEETVLSGTYCGTTLSGYKEQELRVTVYDIEFNMVSGTDYVIDYMDGRIVTSGIVHATNISGTVYETTPAYVTYDWHYVSVVDEWAAIEAANPPVVVVDIQGTDKMGYQLGAGRKVVRKVDIHIFASNPAERNDLVETIYDSLYNKSAPLYDFPEGTILEYDGTWFGRKDDPNKLTSLFSRATIPNVMGNMQFENVTSRHVNLPLVMTRDRNEVMLSDLNAYRSKISFDLVTYLKQ